MQSKVDHKILRNGTDGELASYFSKALENVDNEVISSHLLDSIRSESLSSRVASVWLSGFANDDSITAALHYEHSITVRRLAIKQFGKRLRKGDPTCLWNNVQGTHGIVQLLQRLSVTDVRLFCRVLARSGTCNARRAQREELLTELVKCLASDYFPESKLKNSETRPLLKLYSYIVPACTSSLVKGWIKHESLPQPWIYRLHQAHPELFQERCIRELTANESKDFRLTEYGLLLHSLPPRPSNKTLSESMQFSLTLLRQIEQDETIKLSSTEILDEIAGPLLRRLERRPSTSSIRAEVLSLVLSILRSRTDVQHHLSVNTYSMLSFATRLWSRNSDRYVDMLIRLIQLVPLEKSANLEDAANLLELVPQGKRFNLLAILLKHLQHFRMDISDDRALAEFKDLWPVQIFRSLYGEDSSKLLERFLRTRPDYFLSWSTRRISGFTIFDYPEVDILRSFLTREQPHVLHKAQQIITHHKEMAKTSREQMDRAMEAKLALRCAIASGSLDLFEETLVWERRFNKDALTLKEIYSSSTISAQETVNLISGIPDRICRNTVTPAELEKSVKHGNKIMLLLLETACQCLKEPSFYRYDWLAVLQTFSEVTMKRFEATSKIHRLGTLTSEDIYTAVWSDTIETLVQAEQIGLQDEHKKLQFNSKSSPALAMSISFCKNGWPSPSFQFMDNFAKQRSELWARHRRTLHPAVVALQSPWTKDLPIQAMLPLELDASGFIDYMPFLVSRAREVVFIDPDVAFTAPPASDEVRGAIGDFVDSYSSALRLLVKASRSKSEREQTAKQAWYYAFKNLTRKGMNALEARRLWNRVFRNAGVKAPKNAHHDLDQHQPLVPDVDEPSEPTEWNPDPDAGGWTVDPRNYPPTLLDCLLHGSLVRHSSDRTSFHGKLYEEFLDHSWSVNPASQEGLFAAALLHVEGKRCPGSRILSHPFPSVAYVRFPALFLDDCFLDRKDLPDDFGLKILQAFQSNIAPSLLAKLCHAMLKRLDDETKFAHIKHETFALLKMLITSDKPQIGLDLVRHVIVERADDSSWYRYLLTPGLLRSLPPRDAEAFLSQLFTGIETKLQQQSEQEFDMEGESAQPTPPVVKVSTVKLLAQIIPASQFVDERYGAKMLIQLFTRSRHIDIRVAIVQSLITVFQRTKDEKVQMTILDALEKHVVPIAAAMNERYPMEDEDWQKAEDEGTVPTVDRPDVKTPGPTLNVLLQAATASPKSVASKVLVERLLLPAYRLSTINNRRWMKLFLQSNNLPFMVDDLPMVPAKPELSASLTTHFPSLVPAKILEARARAMTINLKPSDELAKINETINKSSEWRKSNAGAHWLELWDNDFKNAVTYGGTPLVKILFKDFVSIVSGGVSHEKVQALVMEQAQAVIMRGDVTFEEQEYLFQYLAPPFRRNEEHWRLWEKYRRPLIVQIISMIESFRTEQWQRDPVRKPCALQDTYNMKLWLLTWPHRRYVDGHQKQLDNFANELLSKSKDLTHVAGGHPKYHDKLPLLKTAALRAWPIDYCFVACKLGSLSHKLQHQNGLFNLLRIEIADEMLRHAERPEQQQHSDDARTLLREWRSSEVEYIRMRGLQTIKILSERNKAHKNGWYNDTA